MEPKYHSANLSLSDLRDECQAIQEETPAKLVHLQAADVEIPVNNENHFNQGRYVELGFMDKVPELKFIPVEAPGKIPSVIADQLKINFLLIFDELIYVDGETQRVLGFGKT